MAAHVYGWFWELTAARGSNGFGPLPITFAELDAWSRLVEVDPAPWEIRAIRAMDEAFLDAMSKRAASKAK